MVGAATSDAVRKAHLPQFDEIYLKTRGRVGKVLRKHRLTGFKNARRAALEILDTAYNVIRDKLLSYAEFYEMVSGSEELRVYLLTVLGDGALRTLRVAANLHKRLRALWLTLRRDLEYLALQGEEVNRALNCVARLVSYVKRKRRVLERVLEIKKELAMLPGLPDTPRVVIAGPPNAGKSSLAFMISKIKTRIADYPFTTKEIVPGVFHESVGGLGVMIMDTPGLLDREDSKRNIIERRALAAIRLPKTIVVFVLDPFSDVMGLENQFSLLHHVMRINPNVIVAVNKCDVDPETARRVAEQAAKEAYLVYVVSALTGEGLDELAKGIATIASSLLKKEAQEFTRGMGKP